jgi:hypothetical protein
MRTSTLNGDVAGGGPRDLGHGQSRSSCPVCQLAIVVVPRTQHGAVHRLDQTGVRPPRAHVGCPGRLEAGDIHRAVWTERASIGEFAIFTGAEALHSTSLKQRTRVPVTARYTGCS